MSWIIQRSGTWYLGRRVKGKDIYRSLSTKDKKEAKRLAGIAEPLPEETQVTPLGEKIEAYLKVLTQRRMACRTIHLYKNAFAHFCNSITSMEDITPGKLAAFVVSLREKAPATQGIIVRNVKTFLKYHRLLTDDMKAVLKTPRDTFKGRFISPEEEEQLLKNCDPLMRRTVKFALETGLRLSQVWGARWEHLSDDGLLFVPGQKGQKDRHIVLTPLAKLAIGALPQVISGRIFDGWPTVEFMMKTFMRNVRKSGIKGRLRFHDLRHTAASRLAEKINAYELRDHFGWSSVALTDRYTHSKIESIRKKIGG